MHLFLFSLVIFVYSNLVHAQDDFSGSDPMVDAAVEADLRELESSVDTQPPNNTAMPPLGDSAQSSSDSMPETEMPAEASVPGMDEFDNQIPDPVETFPNQSPVNQTAGTVGELKEISFSNSRYVSNVNLVFDNQPMDLNIQSGTNARQLIIPIPNYSVRKLYIRPIDTSEFSSNVLVVTPFEDPKNPSTNRLIVTMSNQANYKLKKDSNSNWQLMIENTPGGIEIVESGKASPDAFQSSDTSLSNSPNPLQDATSIGSSLENVGSRGNYTGSLMSLSVKDAEVKDVLRLIAEVSGFSIIFGDEVTGKITLTLKDVPWDQVLEIVMQTRGLGSIRHENVLRVTTLENLMSQRQMEARISEAKQTSETLDIRVIPVKYAEIGVIASNVKGLLS
jgi:hypothetical protein